MNLRETISNVIKEELGVPNNIYETSVEVYNDVLNQLKKYSKEKDYKNGELKLKFKIKKGLRIADYVLPKIDFKIIVHGRDVDGFEIMSMNVESETERPKGDNLTRMKRVDADEVVLKTILVGPKEFNIKDLISFFEKNKSEFIVSLSHELKHVYDHHKGEWESVPYRATYAAVSNKRFNIDCVDIFFHDLYFVLASENLVRSTEIASAIKVNKISQEDFIDFLKDNTTYLNLKRISNFTLDGLKNCLKKEMGSVDKFLSHMGFDNTVSDEEKVDEILRLIYINLINWKGEAFKDILASDFTEQLMGFRGVKQRVFNGFIESISRFEKNPEDFFRYEEKNFRYVANQMIKKISKLYAITNPKSVES